MEATLIPSRTSPVRDMLLIGCAWFGMNVFFAFNIASVPLFFDERVEQKWVVGLVLGMMGGFGIFVSPISGFVSDRIRHRFGRRRPLMILALPFLVLLLMFTQYIPSVSLICLIWPLVYFSHLIIERPYSALIPDLFAPNKRATANGVSQFMGGAGSLLYFLLIGRYVWPTNREATFYLVGLVYAAALLLLIVSIRERPSHLDEIKVNHSSGFFSYFKELGRHTALVNYSLASLFWQIGLNAVMPWLTSFGTKEMGMSFEASMMILAMSVVILIVTAVPVGMVADRIGRTRITSFGLLLLISINASVLFVHSIPLLFVLMAIVSIGFCILMVVPFALLVDLIPEDRMAEWIGVATIPVYISILIGPPLSGLLIDIFGSYRPIFGVAAASHALGFILLQRVKEAKASAAIPQKA